MYLRREPTTDATAMDYFRATGTVPKARHYDIVIYRDAAMTKRAGRWPWYYSSKPRRGCKQVMFNCYSWRAIWCPDIPAAI